jgi:hypothetical protein
MYLLCSNAIRSIRILSNKKELLSSLGAVPFIPKVTFAPAKANHRNLACPHDARCGSIHLWGSVPWFRTRRSGSLFMMLYVDVFHGTS